MRKQWVKRENIYYVPFYKTSSLKCILILIMVAAFVFFMYQYLSITTLQEEVETSYRKRPDEWQQKQRVKPQQIIMKGIRLKDYDVYNPAVRTTFNCLKTGKQIRFDQVNDDYCDCEEDGSDEPETNACENGVFYCKFQQRHITGRGRDIFIHSSRVNDGICDCCDGSDEWIAHNGAVPKCSNSCNNL